MIVQCDKCSAKFRLDDSKVREGGVKVRCSKCSNIFVVKGDAPAEDADFDSFLSGLMPPPQADPAGPAGSARQGRTGIVTETPETPQLGLAESQAGQGQSLPEEPVAQDDFDLSEFAFDDQELGQSQSADVREETKEAAGDSFVFGELNLEREATSLLQPESTVESSTPSPLDEFTFDEEPARTVQEFDFTGSGTPPFGNPEDRDADSEAAPAGEGAAPLSVEPQEFSFETAPAQKEVGFTDSASTSEPSIEFMFEPDSSELEPAALNAAERKDAEPAAAFDFTQFDFGDEPSGKSVEAETSHVAVQGVVSQERTDVGQISADSGTGMDDLEGELPPLSIASRRKGASSLPVAVVAVCILVVLLLAGGGFFLVKEGPEAFNKVGLGFMAKWFGAEGREEGGIAVRNATGVFLVNKELGEIFAVTGEAVNNFSKPRASIQVRVNLIGSKGELLAQKSAYCGNPLSRDQLVSLPAGKLETAMNNQFGDSLSNLAVQPGKEIPFVVVLTNVPKETAEFGVEVLGSTVASQ